MEICIVTSDTELARFLTLELADAGISASVAQAPDSAAMLCLCDLDTFTGELPENAVGFSYDESKRRRVHTFLPRPLHAKELIRTVTERLRPTVADGDALTVTADRATRRIRGALGTVRLSEKEFALLEKLCATDLLTREAAASIFGDGDSNVVDVYMHYLRKKLKTVCPYDMIGAKRGAGYALQGDIHIRFS